MTFTEGALGLPWLSSVGLSESDKFTKGKLSSFFKHTKIHQIYLFVCKKKKKTLEGYKRNWSSQLPPGSGTGLKKDKDGKETFHSIYSFGHFEL